MKVTLVGNAGVWLRETGHSLLLDSLYGKNEFFSSPLAEMDAAAAGLASHFRDADAVLFSHRHEDHFNARLVNDYLRHNEVKKVYIPRLTEPPNEWEDRGVVLPATSGAQIISVGEHGETIFYDNIGDDCWVVFFKTTHMGGYRYDARHYSVIVIFHGYSYIFMADTDWTYPVKNVQSLLGQTKLQAVFVNPLSYMDTTGMKWLRALQPPRVVIYHVPYEGEDKSGLRRLVNRELQSQYLVNWDLLALTEPMQTENV